MRTFLHLWRGVLWWGNKMLLRFSEYEACGRCRWAFRTWELTREGLCPGCDSWLAEKQHQQEKEARIQAEIEDGWREYRRERQEEHDQTACSFCGHPLGDHAGPDCMVSDCFCSEEYFDELAAEEAEPATEVWFTEPPCGHRGYE